MTESISYRATFRCDKHGLVAEIEVKRILGYGDPVESWSMVNGTGMWFRELRALTVAERFPGGCQACRDEEIVRARAAEKAYWDRLLAPAPRPTLDDARAIALREFGTLQGSFEVDITEEKP